LIKPVLFVLSAPSGAGKSTLIRRVRAVFPDIFYSVSYTTRFPRKGEVDSVDYHFVDKQKFLRMIDDQGFLEWKLVHGSMYGTPRIPIENALRNGARCLLDIDVLGALEAFQRIKNSVGIFIKPPNMAILEERIRLRGLDSEESIKLRMENAQKELMEADNFPYQIVNDDLKRATEELIDIIRKESENS
jgi:guanylate kinase